MRLRAAARAPEEPSSALVPNPEYVTLKLAVFATCRVTFVRLRTTTNHVSREKKALCKTRTRYTHTGSLSGIGARVERSDAGAGRRGAAKRNRIHPH